MAKKHGGEFVLRIEDTDRNRYVKGAEEEIFAVLEAYGLIPDESTNHEGKFGPYRQSDRKEVYLKYARKLVENGHAYYSFETKEDLDQIRKRAMENNERVVYRSSYRDLPLEKALAKVEAGEEYVIRQKMPEGEEVTYVDPLQGKMAFKTDEVDEGVLLKSDGLPTYHLAVVVDDHLMQITHAFRGVEWISSLPKHILLYKAFGWEMPQYVHLSLILDPGGGKLSKRKGTVAAGTFLEEGYLPEAMLNFLMLLGWSSPEERKHGEQERELFSLDEFVEMFSIDGLNKSSPTFDREKLLWFNSNYLQKADTKKLAEAFISWLERYANDPELLKLIEEKDTDFLERILVLEQQRVKLLSELPGAIMLFYGRPEKVSLDKVKRLKKLPPEMGDKIFTEFLGKLAAHESFTDWDQENWEQDVRSIADGLKLKAGEVFMTLRIGVTSSDVSPPLYETMEILGKEEVTERLKRYL